MERLRAGWIGWGSSSWSYVRELGVPWYRFLLCAAELRPIRTFTGLLLTAPHLLSDATEADIVIVPGPRPGIVPVPATLLDALRCAYQRGARILSFCTGAFLLAEAGLLDGRRVTTHWRWCTELATRYPKVQVDPGVLFIDDGQILTSAGTAAAIDLSLHVVRQDYGANIAAAVARRMVVPPQRHGGQAQYIETPLVLAAFVPRSAPARITGSSSSGSPWPSVSWRPPMNP